MPKKVKGVTVTQLSHNLMTNECPYRTPADKKKVRMVRVSISFFTDSSKKKTDSVYMECCCEHQYRAEESLRASHDLD